MKFDTEEALCRAFAETIPDAWTAYNETAGFDIVLVHDTGFQIGIEAKLRLNAKVISQILPRRSWHEAAGPDCRAVLVGSASSEMMDIVRFLQITPVEVERKGRRSTYRANARKGSEFASWPKLPGAKMMKAFDANIWRRDEDWFDLYPEKRLPLPAYVPDVPAGVKSPVVLSDWKIQAIKVCVIVEKFGTITRAEFRALRINTTRWMDGNWLAMGPARGEWVAGPGFPAPRFRADHPIVYTQIESDLTKWPEAEKLAELGKQGNLKI